MISQEKPKPCRVCGLGESEVKMLNKALLVVGQSPRSAARRYAGITRRDLQKHRDLCLVGAVVEGEG